MQDFLTRLRQTNAFPSTFCKSLTTTLSGWDIVNAGGMAAHRQYFFLVPTNFFSLILLLKLGVKINLRILTKNDAADLEIGFLTKSISKPCGRATAMPPAWELNWPKLPDPKFTKYIHFEVVWQKTYCLWQTVFIYDSVFFSETGTPVADERLLFIRTQLIIN